MGGLARESLGGPMGWHKALGVFVLGFGLWRVGWRMVQGFAAESEKMPPWQRSVARAVHVLLLAAIVLMPLSGILMTVAGGRGQGVGGLGCDAGSRHRPDRLAGGAGRPGPWRAGAGHRRRPGAAYRGRRKA